MIKALLYRIQQCLGTITMLLVQGSSEKRLFRHLSDYVFEVRDFRNTKSTSANFFFKIFKVKSRFKKCSRKLRKSFFCFWGKFIWTTIVKLSLLRTGYLSSESNLLTSSPKIWHVNKRDFFWLNWLGSDQWIL